MRYDDEKRTSKDLLTEIHKNLGEIDLERLVRDNKPTANESKGFIHILADDDQKEIWWGDER
ncbi:hypothetical protein [Jeotgalicoccus sp. WY2]|uniref:hypothetical protein n=1 Tax=Jeotgalicoccus sp. WY2 TaxID=2708346 RepID=UPI001BD65501|nr:hypothetical protein [Jeotgalicoccus sp. WY2]